MSETNAVSHAEQTLLRGKAQVTSQCAASQPGGTPAPGERFGIVVIGASAGGIGALMSLVAEFPPGFPAPILICQHVLRSRPSLLPVLLGYRTRLRVVAAEDEDVPQPGSIYVAPSNRHLLVRGDGRLGLSDAERVNFCRPSVDVLFRSVAEVYGARALAVVLTGYGRDGAQGIRKIQQHGGLAIAQDENSSEVFDMPLAARDLGGADLVLPLRQVAAALQALVEYSL
jgi:two-component system chemotaxis response regulator CheB